MCVLSIKVPIRKKSGNLFNDPHIYIYIYIYIYIHNGCHNVQNGIVLSEKVGITFYLSCFRFYNLKKKY